MLTRSGRVREADARGLPGGAWPNGAREVLIHLAAGMSSGRIRQYQCDHHPGPTMRFSANDSDHPLGRNGQILKGARLP